MRRLTPEQIQAREYLTPGQCAAILGRGATFWRDAFDRGHVTGYRANTGRRHIRASSAREYLETGRPQQAPNLTRKAARAAFLARCRELGI